MSVLVITKFNGDSAMFRQGLNERTSRQDADNRLATVRQDVLQLWYG